MSIPAPPSIPNPVSDDGGIRGQMEPLGVLLMLSMVVIGTTIIIGIGAVTLNNMETNAGKRSTQHGLTQFDSDAARVALGSAAVRSNTLGTAEGTYHVDPSAGRITITHVDYNGTNDHQLYSAPLGAVVYQSGETTIAYQGGGVWRVDETGSARMISPPEFHYQGATLTLPVIRVGGDGSAGGAPTARIRKQTRSISVYADPGSQYPDGDPFSNPIENGHIEVSIETEYADAWADYFRTRTEGDVSVAGDTATVELISVGTRGDFQMPYEGNSIDLRGMQAGHTLDNFTIVLRPDDTDSADFSNLHWSMYDDSGDHRFEVHLRQNTGNGCTVDVAATVYYSPDDGSTYHGWRDADAFTTECGDYNGDGDDEVRLVANLTGTANLEYQSLSSSDLEAFDPSGQTLVSSPTFNQHSGTVGWESITYSAGDDETMHRLLNHYFGLDGPDFEPTVDDKNSDSVTEGASYGNIQYPPSDEVVTYLHVTENEITVVFEE